MPGMRTPVPSGTGTSRLGGIEGSAVIRTERLVLRRVVESDLEALIAMHADPDLERFMGHFGAVEARSFLSRQDSGWTDRGYGRMVIRDRESGGLIGRTGLSWFADLDAPELGWTLRRTAWGRGYAMEAARAVLNWGFGEMALPSIISMIEPANARSIQVALRVGMSFARTEVWHERTMSRYFIARSPLEALAPPRP